MIQVQHLSKKFDEKILFQDFNYSFEKGKSYALIGSSGSGKTTLLNMLAKLEPIDKGAILIGNKKLSNIKESDYFKNSINYLFQNYGLIDNESIYDNLILSFINKPRQSNKSADMKKALSKVGLKGISLKRKIYSLSGGEAQRVALAKMILKDSPIILADEPTGSLDPITGEAVTKLLLSLSDDNKTIIIATHNPYVWEQTDEVIDLRYIQ